MLLVKMKSDSEINEIRIPNLEIEPNFEF